MCALRILVADDSAPWRLQARALLQECPEWQLIEACDGREAVHKAAELHPNIVLLDIGMPILNGLEAAKQIRVATPTSSIIFVSQNGDGDVKTAALATGAVGYLSKANAASELLPAIAAALRDGHLA